MPPLCYRLFLQKDLIYCPRFGLKKGADNDNFVHLHGSIFCNIFIDSLNLCSLFAVKFARRRWGHNLPRRTVLLWCNSHRLESLKISDNTKPSYEGFFCFYALKLLDARQKFGRNFGTFQLCHLHQMVDNRRPTTGQNGVVLPLVRSKTDNTYCKSNK